MYSSAYMPVTREKREKNIEKHRTTVNRSALPVNFQLLTTLTTQYMNSAGRVKEGRMENTSPNVGLEPTTLGLRVPCSTD